MSGVAKRTVKVAVVGSGLAGLTAAHRLRSAQLLEDDIEFEVHLFEKSSTLGMDAHSINIPPTDSRTKTTHDDAASRSSDDDTMHSNEDLEKLGSDERSSKKSLPDHDRTEKTVDGPATEEGAIRVDVPMRAFIGGYYPQLIKLYKHIGVKFQKVDYTHSISSVSIQDGRPIIRASTLYNGNTGLSGIGMPSKDRVLPSFSAASLAARFRFITSTLLLLLCYIRLIIFSFPLFHFPDMTFGAWIERRSPKDPLSRCIGLDRSWDRLCLEILLPIFSGICTASRDEILSYPVVDFLECIWAGFLQRRYVALNHVQDVVERLSRQITHIHTNSAVASIQRDSADPSKVTILIDDERKQFEGFSHVVFACQASAVPQILSTYAKGLPDHEDQRLPIHEAMDCLEKFQYKTTVVINHTDDSFLPLDQRDRRDINMVDSIPGEAWPLEESSVCRDHSSTMVTQIIPRNKSKQKPQQFVFQTTSPMFPPQPESILSVSYLERAVPTTESKKALDGLSTEERKWWRSYSKRKTTLGSLQGCGRTQDTLVPGFWFCGSYACSGIPLLEGCVVSAKNVVDQGILASEKVQHKKFKW